MSIKDPTEDFNEDQKRYLEGFLSGIDTLRQGQGLEGTLFKHGCATLSWLLSYPLTHITG